MTTEPTSAPPLELPGDLAAAYATANTALAATRDLTELDGWYGQFMSGKGEITLLARGIGSRPPDERKSYGQAINQIKAALQSLYDARREEFKTAALGAALEKERLDVTLPGRPAGPGYMHVITKTMREMLDIWKSLGFQIAEGPEVELDYYNFQQLNMPPGHPARSMHDTFYFSESVLLRTHTSPNQIRIMEQSAPPIRVVVPGRVYRNEATDASHLAEFSQIEGLAVDKNITLADLRGALSAFARHMFGDDRQTRFRVDYFPYVEPGVDFSINCIVCNGAGCRTCKYTGWIEILGAGMVHPQVLRNVGVDPDVYTGFAFGMGPERIALLKYGIDDIRQFYNNDLRFLRQFA